MALPKKAPAKKAPVKAVAKKAPAKKAAPASVPVAKEGVSDPPALTPDIIPIPGDPAPITPSTTPDARQDRVLFENFINEDAERFAREAKDAFIAARLDGKTVTLTTSE